jgi:hypothetical protein
MQGRLLGATLVGSLVCAGSSVSFASAQDSNSIPLPTPGNVSVARLVIEAEAARTTRPPRLAVQAGKLPGSVLVLGAVSPQAGAPGRFLATVAIFDRSPAVDAASGSRPSGSSGGITIRLPSGYRVSSRQVAANVLYQNAVPRYPLGPAEPASVLAGTPPPRIAASRLLADAQKLALERNVAIADMELLGLEYVSADIVRTGGPSSYAVTIGVSGSGQVNAVQLTFPSGVRVLRGAGPPRTEASPFGTFLRLTASDRFQEAVPYRFTLALSRPLAPGSSVTLRASTHYFENVLPFTERLLLPS